MGDVTGLRGKRRAAPAVLSGEQDREVVRAVLKRFADSACDQCGGTGDIEPAIYEIRPCGCVLNNKLVWRLTEEP